MFSTLYLKDCIGATKFTSAGSQKDEATTYPDGQVIASMHPYR